MDLFHSILELFSQLEPIHYMLLVFLAYFIENIFPPLPGDTMLVFSAYVFGLYFNVGDFIWLYGFSVLGAILGFMLMVFLGKRFDRQFFVEKNWKFASSDFMIKGEKYMDHYGAWMVLGNRIFFGMRPVIGLVSGMSKLKWYHILILVTVSSLVFNAVFMLLGYVLGQNWELIESILKKYSIFTIFALAGLIVFAILKIRRHEPKS
ncbi:MAG: DedA family protein [Candidatus Marinimicrobia bacterium]|nr:DedA family protein [Candidatus Neomarinimicrobiota bacterium]